MYFNDDYDLYIASCCLVHIPIHYCTYGALVQLGYHQHESSDYEDSSKAHVWVHLYAAWYIMLTHPWYRISTYIGSTPQLLLINRLVPLRMYHQEFLVSLIIIIRIHVHTCTIHTHTHVHVHVLSRVDHTRPCYHKTLSKKDCGYSSDNQ